MSPITPAQFATALLEDNPDDQPSDVGDDATVVDNGQVFTGKVAARDPSGRLKLSFSGRRPSRQDFQPNEIKRIGPAGAPPASPSAPRKPPVAGRGPGSFL